MTFLADMDDLKHRITRAEAVREAWRISGRQENYLEACSIVDALEAQLETLERSARDSAAQARGTAPAAAPSEPPRTTEELMARLGIVFDGRSFRYGGYRYDSLADAVNYAELEHRRPSPGEHALQQIREPTAVEQELMRGHAITFENGVFRWRGYQYDRLSDALAYAKLHARPSAQNVP
jgi:hypothetical protein